MPYIIVQRVQGVAIRRKWYKKVSAILNKNCLYFEEHIKISVNKLFRSVDLLNDNIFYFVMNNTAHCGSEYNPYLIYLNEWLEVNVQKCRCQCHSESRTETGNNSEKFSNLDLLTNETKICTVTN
jgi:hypothetical protein